MKKVIGSILAALPQLLTIVLALAWRIRSKMPRVVRS